MGGHVKKHEELSYSVLEMKILRLQINGVNFVKKINWR